MQDSRASSRRESRRPSRPRHVPRLDLLEDRLAPAILTVTSITDGSLANLAGDGKLQLREAIEVATHPGTAIEGITTNDIFNTIQFSPIIDGGTIYLSSSPINDASVPGPTSFRI